MLNRHQPIHSITTAAVGVGAAGYLCGSGFPMQSLVEMFGFTLAANLNKRSVAAPDSVKDSTL